MTTTLNASTAGAGGFIATSDNSGSLALQTAGTTAVTIDTSQNVGIGTTSPTGKLHVSAPINTQYGTFDAVTSTYAFTNYKVGGTSYGYLGDASGLVSGGTAGDLAVRFSGAMVFSGGANERMRIDSSGNVGIGTTSPSSYGAFVVRKANTAQGVTNASVQFSDAVNSALWVGHTSGAANLITESSNITFGFTNGSATTERARITTAGLLQFNSGYGSVATAYGCRVWVQFNGTGTISITGSGNVSSISDFGVGDYGVTFTTNMPDTTYCVVGSSIKAAGGPSAVNSGVVSMSENINTYSCGISVISASQGAIDRAAVFVAVFR